MKILIVFALLTSTAFASENSNKCETELNQNALRCQKMRQICGRMGPAESLPYEMCMEDVYTCIQEGRDLYQACVENSQINK